MLLEDGEARTRRNKRELVDARPSNAARCCRKTKVTKRDLVVASTPQPCALAQILPETTVRA